MNARTVIVTGATGVLGGEIVRALSREYKIIALFGQDFATARQLENETGCRIQSCDIGDEAQVERILAEAAPLYGVVHAAAIAHDALLARQSYEDWRETMRVNLDGAFLVTRAALRYLSDGGRLILFTSQTGIHGGRGQAAYSASKSAVIALMQSAAREGAQRGITANAICPGFAPSKLSKNLSEEEITRFRRQSVLNHFGSPLPVVSGVRWLLSEAGREVSGQVIHCHSRL